MVEDTYPAGFWPMHFAFWLLNVFSWYSIMIRSWKIGKYMGLDKRFGYVVKIPLKFFYLSQ